jgi:hypothetical protein
MTCCRPLPCWCGETATCHPWSPSMAVPTACWPAAATSSVCKSATGRTPSPPAASSPAWTLQHRRRSADTVDDPLGHPKWSRSAGHSWRCPRPAYTCRGCRQHFQGLCLLWLLRGHHHRLGWGPEPFFLPKARGFLYARAPPGCSSPPHRPCGNNDSAGCRSA